MTKQNSKTAGARIQCIGCGRILAELRGSGYVTQKRGRVILLPADGVVVCEDCGEHNVLRSKPVTAQKTSGAVQIVCAACGASIPVRPRSRSVRCRSCGRTIRIVDTQERVMDPKGIQQNAK